MPHWAIVRIKNQECKIKNQECKICTIWHLSDYVANNSCYDEVFSYQLKFVYYYSNLHFYFLILSYYLTHFANQDMKSQKREGNAGHLSWDVRQELRLRLNCADFGSQALFYSAMRFLSTCASSIQLRT